MLRSSELSATASVPRFVHLVPAFPSHLCPRERLTSHSSTQYVARHYPAIQVGFFAHPSFVDEDELAGFKGPLSIAAAETDEIFPAEKRHASEKILAKGGHPYQINLYSQVVHGFSVRCDLSKPVEKYAKEQAFLQAVTWFDTWLLSGYEAKL